MGERDHVPLVVLGDGKQPVHVLKGARRHPDGVGDLFGPDPGEVLLAHVAAHRGETLEDGPDHLLVPSGEKVRQVLDRDAKLVYCGEDVVRVGLRSLPLDEAHHRRERRHVPDHREGAVLGVKRQRDPPLDGERVDRGASGGLEPVLRNPVAPGLLPDLRVVRIEKDGALGGEEVPLVGGGGGLLDPVGVVEDQAEVAEPPDAGLGADRRLPHLDARVAQGALLGLAGLPVEVDLLVRASRDAVAPAAALLLVHKDYPVLLALVHRPRGAGCDARGVQAVLADAREVHHKDLLVLEAHRLFEVSPDVRIEAGGRRAAGEVVVPVRAPLQVERVAGDLAYRLRDGLVVARRGLGERLVVVGPGLVVVV